MPIGRASSAARVLAPDAAQKQVHAAQAKRTASTREHCGVDLHIVAHLGDALNQTSAHSLAQGFAHFGAVQADSAEPSATVTRTVDSLMRDVS